MQDHARAQGSPPGSLRGSQRSVEGEIGIAEHRDRERAAHAAQEGRSRERHGDDRERDLFGMFSDLNEVLAAGDSTDVAHQDDNCCPASRLSERDGVAVCVHEADIAERRSDPHGDRHTDSASGSGQGPARRQLARIAIERVPRPTSLRTCAGQSSGFRWWYLILERRSGPPTRHAAMPWSFRTSGAGSPV